VHATGADGGHHAGRYPDIVQAMILADFLGMTGDQWVDSLGLVFTFFILMPVLLHGLIGFAVAQVLGERQENLKHQRGEDVGSSQG
jgi:hypothetical protein